LSENSEYFTFAPEETPQEKQDTVNILKPWKILIADDEKDVHTLSKIVLSSLEFENRGLEILEAYNGVETKRLLLDNPDCALVILDVVMDTDDEGLSLVKWIRGVIRNETIRIILRTGQPGDVPEKELIINYDIDGYREKTELTDQKLFTSVYTALRSYKDLKTLKDNKKALEGIIHSSTRIFSAGSLSEFIYYSMYYLVPIISKKTLKDADGLFLEVKSDEYYALWGSGLFTQYNLMSEFLTNDDWNVIDSCRVERNNIINGSRCAISIKVSDGRLYIFFLSLDDPFILGDDYLLEIYLRNIEVGLEKMLLTKEIEDTQKEIIYTLGDVVESRSLETGSHVRRVGEMSYKLALLAGFSEREGELIKTASPMHDIGKIGIPEIILHKGDALTLEERAIVETHTTKGYELLKGSNREIIKSAAIIALQHHEHWDGSGYPMGLEGEHIHNFARITTVVDVFDALFHDRVYKKAWSVEKIIDFFKKEKGKMFDPKLTDLFLENVEEFILICNEFI